MVSEGHLSPEPSARSKLDQKSPSTIEKIAGTPAVRRNKSVYEPDDHFSHEYSRYLRQFQNNA